jgi:hypothetical protein
VDRFLSAISAALRRKALLLPEDNDVIKALSPDQISRRAVCRELAPWR